MSIRITWFPLPTRVEILPQLEARESVRFGVEDYLVKREECGGREEKVKVFECFGLFTSY